MGIVTVEIDMKLGNPEILRVFVSISPKVTRFIVYLSFHNLRKG